MNDMIKVLICGYNGYGKKVAYMLDDKKYEITAFVDTSEHLQNTGVHLGGKSIPCISESEIINHKYDYIILAINRLASKMENNLIALYGHEIKNKIIIFEEYKDNIVWLEERHAMLRNCIDEILNKNIQGNVAELGVYKGEFAKYLNRYLPNKKIYLFDTFSGFGTDVIQNSSEIGIRDMKYYFDDTSVNEVMGQMENIDNVIIKKGLFPKTAEGLDEKFCLVSIDADLYEPIFAGLEYFYPRLEKGGYIFIHDFGMYQFKGAKKAVLEYCNKQNISYVPILDSCLSAIITK